MVLRYLISEKHKLNVRLACVKHLDSVQSEPSPNSSIKRTFLIKNAQTFIQFFVYKVMQFTFNKNLSNSFCNYEDICIPYNPNNLPQDRFPYGTTPNLNNLFFDHKLHLLLIYTFDLTPTLF